MELSGKAKWLGALTLGSLSLYGGGCSSTASDAAATEKVRGRAGESCQARDDCEAGLSCIRQVCMAGMGGAAVSQDASVPAAPLGGLGESCQARADCQPDLACFGNVCSENTATAGDAGSTSRVGKRGESCRTRVDCEANLACIDGTCTLVNFGLTPTTKKCVLVECQAAIDCCPKQSSSCPFYDQYCKQGDQAYCDLYKKQCECDETRWACTENKCEFVPTCDPTTLICPVPTCSPASPGCKKQLVCAGTRCVECTMDADCGKTGRCSDQKCFTKCDADADCPSFYRCEGGACVESGCTTDRECIADTGNVLSSCQDGECLAACETDLECDSPTRFTFKTCIAGYCRDVGCETDEECRIALNVTPNGSKTAVCQ